MTKKLTLAILLLCSSAFANASDFSINITNNSAYKVKFGKFKGTKVPSLCEDGFCWEEVFIKLRPLSRKFKNIKSTVTAELVADDFVEKSMFLVIEGVNDYYRQIEFVLCDNLEENPSPYYPEIDSTLNITDKTSGGHCLNKGETSLIVE